MIRGKVCFTVNVCVGNGFAHIHVFPYVDIDRHIHQRPIVDDRSFPGIDDIVGRHEADNQEVIGAPRFIDVIFVATDEAVLLIEEIKSGQVSSQRDRLFQNMIGLGLHLPETFLEGLVLFRLRLQFLYLG